MNMVIKVADFGLAVNTGDKDYYRLSSNMGIKLPVMWMAPESLANRVFSEMSDVVSTCTQYFSETVYAFNVIQICICSTMYLLLFQWSYGVTCWEIFSGGQAPYAGTKPSSLLSLLQEGERLKIPKNSACSDDMYDKSHNIHYYTY